MFFESTVTNQDRFGGLVVRWFSRETLMYSFMDFDLVTLKTILF